MGKKRKAPKTFEQSQPAKSTKYDVEETFNDSEDEFYTGRDKILLDDSADTKRRRRLIEQEKDLQLSDDEVLPYTEDDEVSEDVDGVDEDEDDYDEDDIEDLGPSKSHEDPTLEDDESEDENWGTNRADYYGDDVIETEEQAKEEEAEAKRLYQKQLKNMTEADFGFDEDDWTAPKQESKSGKAVTEKLPEAQIPEGATQQQQTELLQARYPEFLPLAEELQALEHKKAELDQVVDQASKQLQAGHKLGVGLPAKVKRNALAAYMASISLYFAVVALSATKAEETRKITALAPRDLHDHPIIHNLARAKELWEQVEHQSIADIIEVPTSLPPTKNGKAVKKPKEHNSSKTRTASKMQPEKASKTKDESKSNIDTTSSKPKKKSSKSKDKSKSLDISDLINTATAEASDSASELGDETPLTAEEYAQKAQKRKSLRFYTSQITSKANKRGHASREAGGDDDLPHKERHRDKQERLLREAQARGRREGDASQLDGGDDDEYDDLPGAGHRDQNDEYYDTLLNAKDKKKADKQARADAYAKAAAEGATVYEEETVGADGKRAITYAIAKNKGLMPKRKKEVRNPRVKKKMAYDKKMKKLGSVRQVYKGGEGRGGYGGELTGIKTNVVKSVKL